MKREERRKGKGQGSKKNRWKGKKEERKKWKREREKINLSFRSVMSNGPTRDTISSKRQLMTVLNSLALGPARWHGG